MWLRTLGVSSLVGTLLFACGGRTDDGIPSNIHSSSGSSGGSSSGGSSGGSSSGSSSGSSGGGSSSSGSSSGGMVSCVFVDISTYDASCNSPSDCQYVVGGEVCDGYCDCGSNLISTSELPRYDAAIASITANGACDCGAPAPIDCVNHQCTEGGSSFDGGPPPLCVYVDTATYDESCKADTDCVEITAGQICSGGCECGGAVINIDGEASYQQTIAPLGTSAACPCPAFGVPRCVNKVCTLCGFGQNQAGCPDAG